MEKKKDIIIYVLFLVVGVLLGVLVMMLTQKNVNSNENTERPKTEEKEKRQKEENIEKLPEEQTDQTKTEYSKTPVEKHDGCSVCNEDGEICCPVGLSDVQQDDILGIPLLEEDVKDVSTEPFDLRSGDYEYSIEYSRKDGMEKVKANGKVLYNKPYHVDYVFVLDNGMMGIQYYDDMDQARLKKRTYFDTKLNKIDTIEGIKPEVYVLSKEFEYHTLENECINNEYHELKYYNAVIGNNSISKTLVRTEKEDGCAGLT